VRRLLLGLLLAACGAPLARADYTVSGRFLYVDREFDGNGFTGVEPQLPIRLADIQVVSGSKVIASGTTDGQGQFLIGVQARTTQDVYVRCLARHETSTGVPIDVRSGNQSGTIWSIASQTFTAHPPNQDLSIGTLVAVPGSGGEAFNILDVTEMGGDYLLSLRGPAPTPLLIVVYNASNPNLSSTSGSVITMRTSGGYDDTVILHEMGHYITNNFSKDDSPGGANHLSDCNEDLRLAFDEGNATAWGLSVRRFFNLPHSSLYVATFGLPGPGSLWFSFDAETQQPFVCFGATSQTTVFAALWDLMDGPATTDESPGVDEPWDMLQGQDAAYWKVVTQYLPTATNVSLEDFWDGWFAPTIANDHYPEMISIFREVDVEYFPDSYETDDSVAEAKILVPGPYLLHQTYFADRNNDLVGEPDTDVFGFDAVGGTSYTIETLNLRSDANTALDLLGPDGVTVLASDDDRSASDPSSLIVYTAPFSGRLFVRSYHAPDVGIYGSYDLRIHVNGAAVDNDMDGYTSDIDCNDNDASIHPGAIEVCNNLDDDCNGLIDDGLATSPFYRDADGDGYGNPSIVAQACAPPSGYVAAGSDCNDSDATIWAVPGEAQGLLLPDPTTLTWSPPAAPGGTADRYNVIRSDVASDFVQSATCVASGISTTATADPSVPAAEAAFFYLIQTLNGCPNGPGPLGTQSNGALTLGRSCP
jgi:hypothetical protein